MNSKTTKRFVTLAVVASLWISTIATAVDEAAARQADQQKPAASGGTASAKEDSNRRELENTVLKIIVIPRTREQMKAFYEGRGFPKPAIAAIAEACFMTVIIKNKTDNVLWLELDNWQLSNTASDAKRLDREFWNESG